MRTKKFVLFGIIGAVLLGLAGGALAFMNVFAQSPTPTPATPNGQVQPGKGLGMRGGFGGGYSEQDLATALGIDVTKLQAAYAAANAEALKEAVSKGLITQAQADQITARGINNRPLGGALGGLGANSGIDYNTLLANALGIDVTKLQAAYTQAVNTNLDNAVKAGTITQAQADLEKARYALSNDTKFQSSLQAAYQAAIQQAVTDGVITQAQADQLLKNQTGNALPGIFGGLGGPGGFGGFGGLRGFDRHGFGGGPGGNTAPETPAQPTATPGSSS
jgi:ribosomal protein S20